MLEGGIREKGKKGKIAKKIKSGKGILCLIVKMQQKTVVFPIKMRWFDLFNFET